MRRGLTLPQQLQVHEAYAAISCGHLREETPAQLLSPFLAALHIHYQNAHVVEPHKSISLWLLLQETEHFGPLVVLAPACLACISKKACRRGSSLDHR